jgi:hypothetical protein
MRTRASRAPTKGAPDRTVSYRPEYHERRPVVRQSAAPPARLASRRVLMGGLATSRVTLGDGVIQLHNDPGGIDSIGSLEIDTSGGSNTHKGSQPSFASVRISLASSRVRTPVLVKNSISATKRHYQRWRQKLRSAYLSLRFAMRQTRMRPVRWESPPGFKCQTRSTSLIRGACFEKDRRKFGQHP